MTKTIDPAKLNNRKRGRAKRLRAQVEMRKVAALAKIEDELVGKEQAAVMVMDEEAPPPSADGFDNILYVLAAAVLIGFLFAAGASGNIFYRLFAGVGGFLLGGISMFILVKNTVFTSLSVSPRFTFGIRHPLAVILTSASFFPAMMIVGKNNGEVFGLLMFAAPSLVFFGLGLFILWRRYDEAKERHAWHVQKREQYRLQKVAEVTAAQARRLKNEVDISTRSATGSSGTVSRISEMTKANGRLS